MLIYIHKEDSEKNGSILWVAKNVNVPHSILRIYGRRPLQVA